MNFPKISYVEPFLFAYMYCLFIIMPVEQQFIYKKVCYQRFNESLCNKMITDHNKSNKYKNMENLVQGETAKWSIYLNILRTLPAIISTILFGAWSDRVGRKTIMILPIFGDLMMVVGYILNAHFQSAPLYFLFIGAAASAIFGNFTAILLATCSYVADISKESSRTTRIIILEAMIFLGGMFGNLSGGWLLETRGFIPVFLLICAIYIVMFLYWLFLKESYVPDMLQNGRKSIKDLINVMAVKESIDVFLRKRKEKFRLSLWLVLLCFIFAAVFFVALNTMSVLFVMHHPLNFSSSKIGQFLAEVCGVKFASALFINLVLVKKLQWSEYSVFLLGTLSYCCYCVTLGSTRKDWQVYCAVLWCFGLGPTTAVTRAAMSKMVSKKEQGKMFSVLASIEVLTSLISSVSFGEIYKTTVTMSPGFGFYILAGLSIFPIGLSIFLMINGQRTSYSDLEEEKEEEEENLEINK